MDRYTATSTENSEEIVIIIDTPSPPNIKKQLLTVPKISLSPSTKNSIKKKKLDIQQLLTVPKISLSPSTKNSIKKKKLDRQHATDVPDLESLKGESHTQTNAGYITPMKEKPVENPINDINTTPEMKLHTPICKAPSNPAFMKKRDTPSKKAFQHVVSPISVYIKQSPVTPLIRNVTPKKPLPGPSAIPKPVRSTNANLKENVKLPSVAYNVKETKMEEFKLPSVAYKTAKETIMIDIPDHDKLPESQWAKQITSSVSRPTVIKHEYREGNSAKKQETPQRDDSLANLSLHQADFSLCTQKSAYKPMN